MNVTGFEAKSTSLQPSKIEEVIRIIRDARAHGIGLYPISRGLNWGYGSRSPVMDGNVVLDLSAMNRILNRDEISVRNPVALIEPGVTQGQLADFLARNCPELTFNVTGAGRDTSILGNALDRGVGYFGPRRDDIFGLEIVTGTGEILRTGFRRLGDESPLATSHPFGLGPILDGLFFQGNFGIVTSACFRLIPRRPKEVAVSLALRDVSFLAEFIDELAKLKREGLLTSVTHIANKDRTQSTLAFGVALYLERECGYSTERVAEEAERAIRLVAPDEWTSLASITGNASQVRAAVREIRRRTSRIARLMIVTERKLNLGYAIAHRLRLAPWARRNAAAISAIRPLHRLALGVPTDVPIENLLWKFGQTELPAKELDQSRCGLLFINPALPLDGQFVATVVEEMKSIAATYGHKLYMTLNIETATSLVAVINLLFDRSNRDETNQAKRCSDALLHHIRSRGLEPYRARVDMMADIVSPESSYWQTVRRLKQVFDPDNIIAPGRYNLPD